MSLAPPRRVVAGLDDQGRSAIVIDGPSDVIIWSTAETPVDNGGTGDRGGPFTGFAMPAGGTRFAWFDLPAGARNSGIGMHATNTIDYVVVVAGELTFVTETGEATLKAGDVAVDRGVLHDWRNDGLEPARMLLVMADAAPVGAGATV